MSLNTGSTWRTPAVARSRLRRLLVPLAVLVAALLVAFSLRVGGGAVQSWWSATHRTLAPSSATMPTSPRIEQEWGIRLMVVQLLADNGLKRGENGLKHIMMCELPTNALLAERYLEFFDGMSIGSNDSQPPSARAHASAASVTARRIVSLTFWLWRRQASSGH